MLVFHVISVSFRTAFLQLQMTKHEVLVSDNDMYNGDGQSALTLIQTAGLPVFPLQYRSLQCLASEVIMKNNIRFQNEVPASLIPFIKMHGQAVGMDQ